MEHIEKNAATSYSNKEKEEDPISGLNLSLRYMIEDFNELIKAGQNNN